MEKFAKVKEDTKISSMCGNNRWKAIRGWICDILIDPDDGQRKSVSFNNDVSF